MNHLDYGEGRRPLQSLHVLRDSLAAESVDLITLDPPFNSKRDYHLLFKSPKGHGGGATSISEAQIEAFEDTWHWNEQAEREFDDLLHQPPRAPAHRLALPPLRTALPRFRARAATKFAV